MYVYVNVYVYVFVYVYVYVYVLYKMRDYGGHKLRLKWPRCTTYVRTGPGEVSSLVTDPVVTPVQLERI